MLYIGTTRHLEELDGSYTLALDVSVTSITTQRGGPSFVLLDGERVARINELDVTPIAELSGARAQSIALVDRSELLVGLEGASLSLLASDGRLARLEAFESVPGRQGWENPAGSEPAVRSIAVSGGSWYVAVHVGGLWRSEDRGRSWQQLLEPGRDVHEVATSGAGLCVATAGGFGWSDDGGESWRWSTEGLHAPYCRAVALSGETVYLSASTGPRTADGRLYRARLGEAFSVCGGSLFSSFPANIDTGTVAADGSGVAFGTSSGQAYRSDDGGESWRQVTSEMRPVTFCRFA